MPGQSYTRRTLGNILIVIGAAALLFVAGYFLWNQYQARQLHARLQQTPAPASVSTPAMPSSSGTISTVEPPPVALPATASPGTRIVPTPQPAATLPAQPTATARHV